MAAPQPQAEWESLLELVATTNPHAHSEVMRLRFRAQNLVRRTPADGAAHALYASTAAWTGQREVAVKHATTAYGLRHSLRGDMANVLAVTLTGLGEYEHASEIYASLIADLGPNFIDPILNAVRHGLISGNTELIGSVLNTPSLRQVIADHTAGAFYLIELLGDAGLLESLRGHQDIVRGAIKNEVCMAEIESHPEMISEGIVMFRYHVLGDCEFRSKKSQEIHDLLWDYYEAIGLPPNIFVGKLETSLWPMHADPVIA